MFDSDILLRDGSTDLTATEDAATGKDFGGPDLVPQTYQVHVPEFVAGSTLDVKIQISDDNATWQDYLIMPQIAAVGEYFITGKTNARYRRHHSTVAGAGADFGAVIIGPVPAGRDDNF
jgi:hypothetical protein